MRAPAIVATATAAAVLVAAAAGGGPGWANAERASGPDPLLRPGTGVKLNRVGRFQKPVYLTSAPGQPSLVFVVEQAGRIRVMRDGRKRGTFLNIKGLVRSNYEEGLFSLAFHPGYERNRLFYVYYVDNAGNLRVDEFKRRGPTRAARGSRRAVLRIRHQPLNTHNADQLNFLGGLLYITAGDGGGPGDPGDDAKSKRSLLGKLLRINPRNPKGRASFSVPRSNPFVGRRGHNTIYSYGLRNPWRFSFDTVTAKKPRIVIGDVGQEGFEEIDYETLRGARGAFFGWDEYEAFKPFECDGRCARKREPPIFAYGRSRGCTVIGGYVVRDRRLDSLYGRYLFTDLCNGQIKSLQPRLRRVRGAKPTGMRVSTPVSFGEDAQGRVHVMSLRGAVFRLDPKP